MADLESHPVPDDVDPDGWTLRVTGAVERPLSLTREELFALPDDAHSDDFECVEGWRTTDLSWRGVGLGTVLARADPTPEAAHVLVHAMDGEYASSFPLDRARDALVALELDGDPLTVDHGGPARLVPTDDGADCWESVKWVAEVEVLTRDPSDRDTAKALALNRAAGDAE